MLDIDNPVQWQVRDERYPTFKPWFTHGMLAEIHKWELKDKKVFEWGGGWSSIFWAFRCKEVVTIETDLNWIQNIREYADAHGITNLTIIHRECNEGDQKKVDYYTEVPDGYNPDIVVVDSVLRHECLLKALTLPRPLIIIHDNWQQDGFVCPSSEEAVKDLMTNNFIQEDHLDHHGKKWATCFWDLKP